MTIILFLIDTSASMCQKAHVNGVQKTYLDIAKGAVETFLKYRQRSQDCMGDRYMLLTFEDPPCNVKAGWKENHATFMNELKNLQSNGLTSMSEALKNAFDLLNLNRMQSGIDTYGQGRCPFYLEPSVIIVVTDGGKYSYRNGVHSEIILPLNAQIPGTKLTKEPFRWDQRLFSLVLRMPGNKMDERVEGKVPPDDSPIEKMCEVTGGRSYRVRSHYVLNQCIESLVQKVQPGVVIHFEQIVPKDIKDGEVQDLAFQQTKKMIYVQKHPTQKTFPVGCWPIPEPYWPDPKALALPPRDAHPKIRIITPAVDEPPAVRNFPIDKYELEACPLTLQVLSKKEPNKIWPVVVVTNGGGHAIELPFGYLKANSTYTVVHFYILPYNYQTLLPLIHDLIIRFNFNPPNDWVYKFSNYVKSIPQYYCPFLRRALAGAQVPYPLLQFILPENLDSYLSPTIANYLKQMKNTAKQDQENLCLRVFKQLKVAKPAYHQVEMVKLNCGLQLKRDLVTHPMLKQTFAQVHSEINTIDNYSIVVPTQLASISTKNYRNPFDIPRKDLIDEISRMRDNFFKVPTQGINLYTKDAGHSLPIAEMGNYQEYLKNKDQPLRELEPTNVRQHMFGNPYKKDKNMVMVDEADLGDVAPIKSANIATMSAAPQQMKKIDPGRMARKRKAGPIRKDFIFRRSSTGQRVPVRRREDEGESSGATLTDYSDTSTVCSSEASDVGDISDFEEAKVACEASGSGGTAGTPAESDDDDDNRLVVDYEFNEPQNWPSLNGHVQDFINGDIGEDEDESLPSPEVAALPQAAVAESVVSDPPSILQHTLQSLAPPILTATPPIVTSPVSAQTPGGFSTIPPSIGITSFGLQSPQSAMAGPVVTSPVAPPTPPAPPLAFSLQVHNDMNDVQEISKILQTCHNGRDDSKKTTTRKKKPKSPAPVAATVPAIVHPPLQPFETEPPLNVSNSSNSSGGSSAGRRSGGKKKNQDTNNKRASNNHNHHLAVAAAVDIDGGSSENNENEADENNDEEQRENIRLQNLEIRTTVFRDIRRPGRNYTGLLEHLELVRGNFDTKFNFVQMCINESLRFRRKLMADVIAQWWEKQIEQEATCAAQQTLGS